MQKIKNIVILILIVGIAAISFFSVNESKIYKGKLKDIHKREEIIILKNKNLESSIKERNFKIVNLNKDIKEKDSIKDSYLNYANHFKAKYDTLVKNEYILAKTPKDSLKVCLNTSGALLEENINLRKAISIQKSISVKRIGIISNLNKNIEDLRTELTNKDNTIKMYKDQSLLAEKTIKDIKRKSTLKTIIIAGIAVVILSL